MGVLERWDDRNQETMEEENRLYRAGQNGSKGVLGGLAAYGLSRLLLWIMPWSFRAEMAILLGLAAALFVGGFVLRRRSKAKASGGGASV